LGLDFLRRGFIGKIKNMKFILTFLFLIQLVFHSALYASEMRDVSFFQSVHSRQSGTVFEGKTWIKNGQARVEYWLGPEKIVSIIKNQKVYNYSIQRQNGFVEKYNANKSDGIGPEILQSKVDLEDFLELMEARPIGNEEINGKACTIYEYQDTKKQAVGKIWIWNDQTFPLKSTIEVEGDLITILYKNIKLDQKINDFLFDIPDNIKFRV